MATLRCIKCGWGFEVNETDLVELASMADGRAVKFAHKCPSCDETDVEVYDPYTFGHGCDYNVPPFLTDDDKSGHCIFEGLDGTSEHRCRYELCPRQKGGIKMEMRQVCEERIHLFGSQGEVTFEECPYCHTPMHLEPDIKDWEKSFAAKLERGIRKKLPRGKLIDSLPRIPWFSDAVEDKEANDPNQQQSHKEWTKEDDDELAGLYAENGIANHKVWANVASGIGRSLYAIERQLRIIIARREFELED